MKKLLALEGGGMKGYPACAILAEIERRSCKPISKLFDLVGGTSVGGIVALSLAAGNSASDTMSFFTQDGPNIFNSSIFSGPLMLLRGYRFSPAPLEAALQKRMRVSTLALSAMKVIIPTVDRISRKSVFFKSFDTATNQYAMWQVARATSAAQTYFPPFALNTWSLWDGGNAANNPAACVYAQAVNLWGDQEDYRMLSLGCGEAPDWKVPANPGVFSIISESLSLLLESNDELPDYQMAQILGDDYFSIQPSGVTTGLADASPAALTLLNKVALQTIQTNSKTIDGFCS